MKKAKIKKQSAIQKSQKSIRNYFLNSLKNYSFAALIAKQAYTCKEKILLTSSSDFGLAKLLPPSMVQNLKNFCETAETHDPTTFAKR
jgi:hypothetical protein